MEKIAIVGSPGAGKSTLAQKLGQILNIEVIHLDKYFWQKGWQELSREDWVEFQRYLINIKQWIIDGTYLSTSEIRLEAADTIIFLDMSRYLCLWRVVKRHFKYAKKPRPDFSECCLDRLNREYLIKVFREFPMRDRKDLLCKIRAVDKLNSQGARKQIITLRSNAQVMQFLLEQEQIHRKQEQLTLEQQKTPSDLALMKG